MSEKGGRASEEDTVEYQQMESYLRFAKVALDFFRLFVTTYL